jgi:hypothetical protein
VKLRAARLADPCQGVPVPLRGLGIVARLKPDCNHHRGDRATDSKAQLTGVFVDASIDASIDPSIDPSIDVFIDVFIGTQPN